MGGLVDGDVGGLVAGGDGLRGLGEGGEGEERESERGESNRSEGMVARKERTMEVSQGEGDMFIDNPKNRA